MSAESAPGLGTHAPATDRPGLRWTVHPAAADPVRAVLLGAVVLVASVLATQYSGSAALGAVSALLLAASLRAWYLPRTYAVDPSGASEEGPLAAPRRLAWSEVRAVRKARFGVYLSTLHTQSRFVRDRGLFLRTAGNREEVLGYARALVREPDAGTPGDGA